MKISVMFFGAYPTTGTAYADVLAIAQAADQLGLHAVWTPERHFQDVGQVFPNPPLLSAALAATTKRIGLRAGSVILPLHHPLRVAEDWSVVDHLSGGRVGLSVATGWHARDFVLAPEQYADRRSRAEQDIALLRRLWAGEAVEFPDGIGTPVAVRPQPRPVQDVLPLWMTTSGSARTWDTAGRLRTGVLAAAAGQHRAGLADRIRDYRAGFAAAPDQVGALPQPTVTIMTHTYVGTSAAEVRTRVAGPISDYLRAYLRQTASDPGGGAARELSEEEMSLLTTMAFERYLAWGGLLGTAERCRAVLADLAEIGCDEVACFVDFGLDRDEIIASLHRLARAGGLVA